MDCRQQDAAGLIRTGCCIAKRWTCGEPEASRRMAGGRNQIRREAAGRGAGDAKQVETWCGFCVTDRCTGLGRIHRGNGYLVCRLLLEKKNDSRLHTCDVREKHILPVPRSTLMATGRPSSGRSRPERASVYPSPVAGDGASANVGRETARDVMGRRAKAERPDTELKLRQRLSEFQGRRAQGWNRWGPLQGACGGSCNSASHHAVSPRVSPHGQC